MHRVIDFIQPFRVGFAESAGETGNAFANEFSGPLFDFRLLDPAVGLGYELIPIAMKRPLKLQADYAGIKILQAALEGFASGERKGFGEFYDGRLLKADITGCRQLELRLTAGGAGADQGA